MKEVSVIDLFNQKQTYIQIDDIPRIGEKLLCYDNCKNRLLGRVVDVQHDVNDNIHKILIYIK